MPCDAGTAAWLKALYPSAHAVEMAITGCDFDFNWKTISNDDRFWDKVIMIGTYWQKHYNKIALNLSMLNKNTEFIVYCFGKKPVFDEETQKEDGFAAVDHYFKFFEGLTVGPGEWATQVAFQELRVDGPMSKYFVCQHMKAILLIDDRRFDRNITETQDFNTGLLNITPGNTNLFQLFTDLFSGTITFQDVMRIGRVIADAQKMMARERALKNAKIVTLSDGTKAAMTEGDMLVVLTHFELLQRFPEISTTLVVSLKIHEKEDFWKYSCRTWGKYPPNALEIVKRVATEQCGGGPTSAGGLGKGLVIPLP